MRYLILGYFLLLPFQFALSPAPGIDLAVIRVATLVLVILWLVRGFVSRKLMLPVGVPSFFLLTFLFLAVFSLLWADNTVFAGRKVLFFCSFLPLFFVLLSWFREYPEERRGVLRAFLYGAFLAAASGIFVFSLQFFLGVERVFSFLTQYILPFFLGTSFGQSVAAYPSLLVNISGETILRASGFFPDPHMFSVYLGMAVPVALGMFFSTTTKKRRWFMVFLTLLLADLLTFSRGGYVGLFCGGLFFFFGAGASMRWNKKYVTWALTGGMIVTLLFSFGPIGTRLFSSFSQTDGSNIERLRLWQEATGHIASRPLLGVGLGNYPLVVKPDATYREPIYAHNLYLDIALELGLVGLVLFLGFVMTALVSAWKVWQEKRQYLSLSLVVSLVVFLTHSVFETALFSVHVLPALLLMVAIGVSYRQRDRIV